MTREEMRKWAENLNPGDKVIVQAGGCTLRIGTVKKVTPAGWVVIEKYGTFANFIFFKIHGTRRV